MSIELSSRPASARSLRSSRWGVSRAAIRPVVARVFAAGASIAAVLSASGAVAAADLKSPATVAAGPYDWTGFYFGGHLGYAFANSNFATPDAAGSVSLQQKLNTFSEAGSFIGGLHAGYNYMLPNRVVLGVEADGTFPAFPNLNGFGVGGQTQFTSPTRGGQVYSDNVLASGTVRGRLGYAPGNWLLYATGGFAWSRDQLGVVQLATGNNDYPSLYRLGYVVGAGVEVPIAPHWTGRLEYLFTRYGSTGADFATTGQRINSDLAESQVRAGVTYHFGDKAVGPDNDRIAFHAQVTEVAQGYPGFRSPYVSDNSLAGHSQADQTTDVTLFAGLKLWKGAEFWINPEIDQGFGLGNTHGTAGFPSGESYKLGKSTPYTRVQRYFVRDTFNLGGEEQEVEEDINQFAGKQTANRVVVTVGKFSAVDVFDTNKYANNPKLDFLNWSLINAGTFDYAGDAWGYSYGGTAELYADRFAFRAGLFNLSSTPAGGSNNATAYGLDPTFSQLQFLAEVEERHQLWGQPGKLKLTAFVSRGRAGSFGEAVNLVNATGADPSDALAAVRHYQSRPGVSVNLEQQLNETVGVFARAGYTDGSVEPWDFTDIDRTVSGGFSVNGKPWGRPDDTFGIAGVLNGLAPVHAAYFAAGGNGILIGDGQLPNTRLEKIFETYYSISLSKAVKVSFDYQFIGDPAYNPQRGPVNLGAVRLHAQF